jgi:hypothetical protein
MRLMLVLVLQSVPARVRRQQAKQQRQAAALLRLLPGQHRTSSLWQQA